MGVIKGFLISLIVKEKFEEIERFIENSDYGIPSMHTFHIGAGASARLILEFYIPNEILRIVKPLYIKEEWIPNRKEVELFSKEMNRFFSAMKMMCGMNPGYSFLSKRNNDFSECLHTFGGRFTFFTGIKTKNKIKNRHIQVSLVIPNLEFTDIVSWNIVNNIDWEESYRCSGVVFNRQIWPEVQRFKIDGIVEGKEIWRQEDCNKFVSPCGFDLKYDDTVRRQLLFCEEELEI